MSGWKALLFHRTTVRGAQLVIGVLMGWAALAKIGNLPAFAAQVHNFRVVPVASENFFALTLPWIELVAALSLVLAVRARAGAIVVSVLLAVFTAGVIAAVARGLDFECGCFGTSDATRVGGMKILQNFAMLAVGLIASLRPLGVEPRESSPEVAASIRPWPSSGA